MVGMNEIEILRDIVTLVATHPKRTHEVESKFHIDVSNIPLTDFQYNCNEELQSDVNVTSSHDKRILY